MADEKIVLLCGHCGNRTTHEVLTEYKLKTGSELIQRVMFDTYMSWRLLQCQTCSKPTLVQIGGPDDPLEDGEIVYPTAKASLTNLPRTIEKEYEATLKVRNISSNACAVLARRTLEAIFTHENAAGRTLMEKVNNLIKSERVPPLVADIAHLGRQIGNLGAHFDKEEVTEADVAAMLDFLETILEYLYVLPAKVVTVKARLNRTSEI